MISKFNNTLKTLKNDTSLSKSAIKKEKLKTKYKILNQNKELKLLYEKKKNVIQSLIINDQQKLIKRNKKDVDKLKSNLNKVEKKLRNYLDFSRSLQINNKELKNTVGRYVNNSQKLERENKNLLNKLFLSEEEKNLLKKKFFSKEQKNNRIFSEILNLNKSLNKNSNKKINYEIQKESISKTRNKVNTNIDKKKDLNKTVSEIFTN